MVIITANVYHGLEMLFFFVKKSKQRWDPNNKAVYAILLSKIFCKVEIFRTKTKSKNTMYTKHVLNSNFHVLLCIFI